MTVLPLPLDRLPELDTPHALTTLEEIAEDIAEGPSASLIYVEGELALYLDEDDTDLALHDVTDRDLALMGSLVELAQQRIFREQALRAHAQDQADEFIGL